MTLLLFLCLLQGDEIRDLIYRAEVYGETDVALRRLQRQLAHADTPEEKARLVRATAVIKHPAGPLKLDVEDTGLLETLRYPNAYLAFEGQVRLLYERTWIALGDWVDEYFALAINPSQISMESLPGHPRPISLAWPGPSESTSDAVLILREAPLAVVLRELSKAAGLNVFIDPKIDVRISGRFEITNWLSLLSRVCDQHDVVFTQRGGNAIFHDAGITETSVTLPLVAGGGREDLYSFLQKVAAGLNMELVFDDALFGEVVESQFVDQPYNEVLECLSIANGFNWSLLKDNGEKTRLIVQKQ